MTKKEWIDEARPKGLPWGLGKGFDSATPVGEFIPKNKLPNAENIRIWSKINGVLRQNDSTSNLLFSVSFCKFSWKKINYQRITLLYFQIEDFICYTSKYMSLEPNDLILTGAPLGFGPVYHGDVVEGGIENLTSVKFTVKREN